MDFPSDIFLPDAEMKGVIRLKVAAICACIDHGRNGDGSALKEEIEPFLRSIDKKTGTIDKITGLERTHNAIIDPHAFLYIEPTGNLKNDVDDVLDALIISIERNQLSTVFLKIGLDDTVDVDETWIFTRDFAKWCASRGIQQDEVCEDYDNSEYAIFAHALDNGNDKRKEFEAPFFDAKYVAVYEGLEDRNFDIDKELKDDYDKLFLENMRLKGFYPQPTTEPTTNHALIDRPMMARERATLLAIIGALCKNIGIDPKDRTAASKIVLLSNGVGVNLSDDTARNVLRQVPDALGARRR